MVERGAFRRDLYFRLNVVNINLPPLRNQRERIIPLFLKMIRHEAEYFKCPVPIPPSTLLSQLLCHPWTGNIRELRSTAKRFVLGLPPLCVPVTERDIQMPLKERLQQIEKSLIEASLNRHARNVDVAAVELGVAKRTLYYRMKQLEISLS
jgi:transcriptional regulator with PAS, ATPase and Fis domain